MFWVVSVCYIVYFCQESEKHFQHLLCGGLQSVGSQRVRHDWGTSLLFTSLHALGPVVKDPLKIILMRFLHWEPGNKKGDIQNMNETSLCTHKCYEERQQKRWDEAEVWTLCEVFRKLQEISPLWPGKRILKRSLHVLIWGNIMSGKGNSNCKESEAIMSLVSVHGTEWM